MTDPIPGDEATPWEPPFAGAADDQVVAALDRLRWTFRWKADGLDSRGLGTTIGASSLTLGGLLKHLAANEDYKFTVKAFGEPMSGDWDDNGWATDDDWEFSSAADDAPESLYGRYDSAVARARARLARAMVDGGLDQAAHITGQDGEAVNLRRLVLDMVEEYGRHTGHADLLREYVDGLVGEDPPPGWRPVSGVG